VERKKAERAFQVRDYYLAENRLQRHTAKKFESEGLLHDGVLKDMIAERKGTGDETHPQTSA